jgi:hypothetical protein
MVASNIIGFLPRLFDIDRRMGGAPRAAMDSRD